MNRFFNNILISFALTLTAAASPNPTLFEKPERTLNSLELYLKGHPKDRRFVRDISRIFNALGKKTGSDWASAIQKSTGKIRDLLFVAYFQHLSESREYADAAKKLLEKPSPAIKNYLRKKGIHSKQTLNLFLQKTSRRLGISMPSLPFSRKLLFSNIDGKNLTPRTVRKVIEKNCKTRNKQESSHDIRNLPKYFREFARALFARCHDSPLYAIKLLERNIPKVPNTKETNLLPIANLELLAELQRFNGVKHKVHLTYENLAKAWDFYIKTWQTNLPPKLHYERINHLLWAARYKALSAHHKNATHYTLIALNELKIAEKYPNLPRKMRKKFTELSAEAYFILAFRLATPRGYYKQARRFAKKGLALPHLPSTWVERFGWMIGFNAFQEGQYHLALRTFEKLAKKADQFNKAAQFHFWAARAATKLKNGTKAKKHWEILHNEFDLSFYATTGINLLAKEEFPETFQGKSYTYLKGSYQKANERRLLLTAKKKFPSIYASLKRTLIFRQAGLEEWAKFEGKLVYHFVANKINIGRNKDFFREIAMLLNSIESFSDSLNLTSNLYLTDRSILKKHPHLLHIAFPRPFDKFYKTIAKNRQLSDSLLLAISRQESRFDPRAESYAGAMGLMQLIIPTAKNIALQNGITFKDPISKLLNPEENIRIASHHLSRLNQRYHSQPHHIFAAYNAGEFSLDAWLKRKAAKDTLRWIEMIPFGQTRKYVKNVWRNYTIYQNLAQTKTAQPTIYGKHTL